jgi:hypothetical protein
MNEKGAKLVWERIRGAAWSALQPRSGPNDAPSGGSRRAELEALVNRMLSGQAVQ